MLSGLVALPASAWSAHVAGDSHASVAVGEHHHHDDEGGLDGNAEESDDPASHSDGDGGHSHLPGATASIDARGPLLVGPALTMGDTLFASRPDDPDRGRPTSPQKRPPRSL